ncbi:MAG: hypothetical protein WCF95_03580 [bacterium]
MNKVILKTRILEFLANTVLPAFEDAKDQLGIEYSDYKENPWKLIIDTDSAARLLGLPLKLCELDFNLLDKDFTIILTVQILEDQDISGFFSICWEHGTMCAKELFFDELNVVDAKKMGDNLKTILVNLSKAY